MEPVLFAFSIAALVLALIFAATNGFHDASSTVATLIACGAATPRRAVVLSALTGFAGALLGGTAVALTMISILTIDLGPELVYIAFAAILSAVIWNLVTWYFGIPSSSTHTLIGGLIGAAIASVGAGHVNWGLDSLIADGQIVGVTKVVLFLIISTAIGFIGGYLTFKLTKFLLRNAKRKINRTLMASQYITSGLLSFSHGANDSQKVMGIMVIVIASAGWSSGTSVPNWVVVTSALAMTMGTLGGGWKIMTTLGRRIYRIKPIHSFDALLSSTTAIWVSTIAGAPVSSTHTVASSIIGVGAADNAKLVQWSVGKEMVVSWLLTIPLTAVLSGLIFILIRGVLNI